MAKKRYYQSEKSRSDESKGMKKAMGKKKNDKELYYVEDSKSMFGFPAQSKVVEYPKTDYLNQYGQVDMNDVAGMDYEMDNAVKGMNQQHSKYRW